MERMTFDFQMDQIMNNNIIDDFDESKHLYGYTSSKRNHNRSEIKNR